MSSPTRTRPDACPGALQTHTAADGELARVRVPGGLLGADALRALATAARELGDGPTGLSRRRRTRSGAAPSPRRRRRPRPGRAPRRCATASAQSDQTWRITELDDGPARVAARLPGDDRDRGPASGTTPRVSCCAGAPGCAKSRADVRADAARAVAAGDLPAGGARQHWAGCERRCGRPAGALDVIATGAGYVLGPPS